MAAAVKWIGVSDVNKDLNVKAKTKAKDLTIKTNDLTFKAKANRLTRPMTWKMSLRTGQGQGLTSLVGMLSTQIRV